MSKRAERIFYQHLTDTEALTFIVREGIDERVLPNDELRPILHWATDYFLNGGLRQAPSADALREEWGNRLDDNEVDLDDEPEDTIEWAIETLKSSWVYSNSAQFARDLVTTITDEEGHIDRVEALGAFATALLATATDLESRTYRVSVGDGIAEALRGQAERAETRADVRGMRIGLPMVDKFTHGIHDGELAILAAGPKTGKSFMLTHSAIEEWRAGRPVCLFTLENSIQMTYDRMACLANGIRYSSWQRGTATREEIDLVEKWLIEVQEKDSNCPLWVLQPPIGRQSFDSMVAEAKARDAATIMIDQLTFVEFPESRKPKHERIGDGLHRLKKLLTSGRKSTACFMAHQINREGVRAADKVGYPEMHHMADSAEIERTADWVFALYASRDDRASSLSKLYTLAARREVPQHFELTWQIGQGSIRANRTIELETER
jgi:hypothetical protein